MTKITSFIKKEEVIMVLKKCIFLENFKKVEAILCLGLFGLAYF